MRGNSGHSGSIDARRRAADATEAFTLIELLVVIAVIAILVGITLPALAGARETSRRVKCAANLRGHGTAIQLYMDEQKGLLPLTRPLYDPNNPNPDTDPSIIDILAKYESIPLPTEQTPGASPVLLTNVSDALKCPSDIAGKDPSTQFEPVWRSSGWSYGYFAGELMLAAEFLTADKKAEAVTKTYEQIRWRDLPVIYDYDDWHPLRAKPLIPRNAVYFGDWRADWATDLTRYQNQTLRIDQVWQDLVCDISRFGGLRLPGCR